MGNASSMLTQYDIEEVQDYCNYLLSGQEIVSLYQRFCELDRNAKGYISADEMLSVPEFAMNPLSKRVVEMVDGFNFKDFVVILSAFTSKANQQQKPQLIFKVYDSASFLFRFFLLQQAPTQRLKEAGYTRGTLT
ncbi:hypothetical protein like AT3G18430 [Hibiscus trionum]|uniref:EF-hand domain-containing protein n=1 Tax=Hibiscus trionum TaxID=183268 RepID=A0A9W7H8W0_HIBTR|nr:hypothetical protein like AT3G18430 [Hibiscus trionum]